MQQEIEQEYDFKNKKSYIDKLQDYVNEYTSLYNEYQTTVNDLLVRISMLEGEVASKNHNVMPLLHESIEKSNIEYDSKDDLTMISLSFGELVIYGKIEKDKNIKFMLYKTES